ncbi:MAG: FeoA family protein [Deltaproteobacteria bacterium]|nr:FeoA family protein [Deltaproteobacteria bacterium]
MPLAMVTRGKVRILGVEEGTAGLAARLAPLGLLPGAEIEVVRNQASGPLIIAVFGSRMVLGRGMAQQIQVR